MKSEYTANLALGRAILNTGADNYAAYNARRETSRTLRKPLTEQPTRDAVPMAVKTLRAVRNGGELLHFYAVELAPDAPEQLARATVSEVEYQIERVLGSVK